MDLDRILIVVAVVLFVLALLALLGLVGGNALLFLILGLGALLIAKVT
jgi:hypothetical protein